MVLIFWNDLRRMIGASPSPTLVGYVERAREWQARMDRDTLREAFAGSRAAEIE